MENIHIKKYGAWFRFALAKIAVEYLHYKCNALNLCLNPKKDKYVSLICDALHEYTKSEKVSSAQATKQANEIWPIYNFGRCSD